MNIWGETSKYQETHDYVSKFDILVNILLARERTRKIHYEKDCEAANLAALLKSLPARPLEMIANSMLKVNPGDDCPKFPEIGEYLEWRQQNKIDSLYMKLETLSREIKRLPAGADLENKKTEYNSLLSEIQKEDSGPVLELRQTIRLRQKDLTNTRIPPDEKKKIEARIKDLKSQLKLEPNNKINKRYFYNENDGYSPKKCQSQSQTRNRSTGRCRKTPCRTGKTRDVTNGQCRNKKSPGNKRKSPSRKSTKRKSTKRKSTKRKSPSKKSRR